MTMTLCSNEGNTVQQRRCAATKATLCSDEGNTVQRRRQHCVATTTPKATLCGGGDDSEGGQS
jgi:hypothetical protein